MTRPHTHLFTRPAGKARAAAALLRGLALATAVAAGGLATYAATAPSALAATLVAGVDGGSWLQHMYGQTHAQAYAHFQQLLDDAGASKAQREQIEGIVEQAMPAQRADMARYHAYLAKLKTLLSAPSIDTAAVTQLRMEQDRVLLDTHQRLTDTLVRAAQVLTPAQRRRVAGEIDRMMAPAIVHHHAD